MQKKKILFIDDEQFLSRQYIESLIDSGFIVKWANNAKRALAIAKTEHFDAIILDIMMNPGNSFSAMETAGGYKTGIAIARELLDYVFDTKIIALTSSTDPEVEAWFSRDDNFGYLNKRETLPNDLAKYLKVKLGELNEISKTSIKEKESMKTLENSNVLTDKQLFILNAIKSSPSRISIEKLSVILLYSKNDVISDIEVLLRNNLIRQDNRDTVNWDNEQATFYTKPASRKAINDLIQNNYSTFSRKLRVFLCHSSNDKEKVRELYRKLLTDNIEPWLDEKNILAGQDWQLEISKAVRGTDIVIVCLTKHSVTKAGYVQREIKFALDVADEQPDGAIFLIPLKFENCDVPDRLKDRQWVNYFEAGGYNKLLEALRARAQSLMITGPSEKL